MPGISLCPGYHQVDAFGPNEEYESEEEITYVTLDLGAVEPTLVPSSSSYRLIGLDTPTPYLQLSGTIFKGQHQSLLGTELLFTDADDDHPDRTKKSLVPVGTTEQRIRFKQVELREKKEASSPELQPVGQVNKAKTKRDRIPGTLDEVAGSSVPEFAASKPRKGRKSKADSKGKGKETLQKYLQLKARSLNIWTIMATNYGPRKILYSHLKVDAMANE
ncbi:hypothetical protein POSPLADRAFT_1046307 [Postia placenta MAD-698-R-SB12]|uniref:Transcription factor TFIIIC triple barrel domain-containing protein n=1 Tax=Postia placenta MAD-698-R-SB12 TaxID=670580 RepID=A0A1X6N2S2_9APHY|nr:hypothetical protein POSPLADRAFT_1046307 [Postia placenta MAD-698-R-SB12]OSX62927.1 hypothetical protein POSPLADRAFT_1046307 [Postia placenta MAD-698-R-SB12]